MFSQEVASKLSDASEEPTVVSTANRGDWDSAERYYRNGNFHYLASVAEIAREERIASSVRGDDTPAVFISTIVEAEGPEVSTEQTPLSAAGDRVDFSTTSPVASSFEPIAMVPQEIADGPNDGPSIFETHVVEDERAKAQTGEVVQADSDPDLGNGEIDVLHLPLAEPERDAAGFGVFTDELETPESGVAQSNSGPAAGRRSTQVDAYDIPTGHSMRYVDPVDLVRQRAIERAENRRRLIEVRKWMGYDPLRPSVTPIPYMSSSAPNPVIVLIPLVVRENQ